MRASKARTNQCRSASGGVLCAQSDAAPGVTWRTYEADLERKLTDLVSRVHRGAYLALPSRRARICHFVRDNQVMLGIHRNPKLYTTTPEPRPLVAIERLSGSVSEIC